MKEIFALRAGERRFSLFLMAVILVLQWLMVSKFFTLFAHYDDKAWRTFMRNFHMSGFDPITYSVVTDWSMAYDVFRHPLLAFFMYPLYALNSLLTLLTGCNCVQVVVGLLLAFCAFYALLFLYRLLHHVVGASVCTARLLTVVFLGFAYIAVSVIVPDHFCISMFLLLLTLWRAGCKIKAHECFSVCETALLFVLTSGVTLTNGAVVLLAALFVNGRRFFRVSYLLRGVLLPAVFMAVLSFALSSFCGKAPAAPVAQVSGQMGWTRHTHPRMDIVVENLFGESLQLHRQHVLGDVLTRRPVIVRYTWKVQYAIEALIVLLAVCGLVARHRNRFVQLCLSVFLFNLFLHVFLGFAINEVYIMTAHWAFVLPLLMAVPARRPYERPFQVLCVLLAAYLWTYHGYLLHRYLTWPLVQ